MIYQDNKEYLRQFINDKCLIKGQEFTLSTGAKSSFYFDCKVATLDGKCLSIIAEEILAIISKFGKVPTAIGGLTMGADFIAAVVAARAFELGLPTQLASIVRKEPKKHGTKNKIENQLEPGTKIVVVDDVITSGGSIKDACEEFLREGYEVVGIIALVDRMAGGKEVLEKRYSPVHIHSIFNKDDFEKLRNETNSSDNKDAVA